MPPSPLPQRVLIATDAWEPQVNGVVKTLKATSAELARRGVEVRVVSPLEFRSVPMPGYPEIRLARAKTSALEAMIDSFLPCAIHIATEGPIGWKVRRICRRRNLPFSTSYHTRFPEYLRARLPVPLALSYSVMRRFHRAAAATLVATQSIEDDLKARGFANIRRWSRGVDLSRFSPDVAPDDLLPFPRPIFLNVGRVAKEKNLEAFLALDLPGSKVVIGDGPARESLQARYPSVHFLGYRAHHELGPYYAASDVFVFPSLTDTFGLVLIEAMACGLPVAAFPVPGPRDVIGASGAGVLSNDLRAAALAALAIDRATCRRHATGFTWEAASNQFLGALLPLAQADHALRSSAQDTLRG
jgi:glycosyltransferase involved in cell wall biosynthesis